MTKTIQLLASILISAFCFSCEDQPIKSDDLVLEPVKSLQQLGDSTFIRASFSMSDNGQGLLIADVTGARVIELDSSFNFIRRIGSYGRGPKELLAATFISYNNSKLYVLDRGNKWIQVFDDDGKYIKTILLNELVSFFGKFAVDDQENIYISYDQGKIPEGENKTLFAKYNRSGEVQFKFGETRPQKPDYILEYNDNAHIILTKDKEIITVDISEPVIERYGQNGDLVESKSFRDHPAFENIVMAMEAEYNAHEGTGLMFVPLFRDVFLWENYLFLLYNDAPSGGDFKNKSSNKVLVINYKNDWEVKDLLTLAIDEERDGSIYFTSLAYLPWGGKLVSFEQITGKLYVFDYTVQK